MIGAASRVDYREIRHFHLFCGLGGGAAGFNRGQFRVGSMHTRFRCLGGVDSDPKAIADFSRLAGVPGTLMDLFDRIQCRASHSCEPGLDWREETPADIRKAGWRRVSSKYAGIRLALQGPMAAFFFIARWSGNRFEHDSQK